MRCIDAARIGAEMLGIDLDLEAFRRAIEIGKIVSALTMLNVALDACRNGDEKNQASSICFAIDISILNDISSGVANAIERACLALREIDCKALKALENLGFDVDIVAEDYARRYGYSSVSYVRKKYVAKTLEAYRRFVQAMSEIKKYLLQVVGEEGIERLEKLGLLQLFSMYVPNDVRKEGTSSS